MFNEKELENLKLALTDALYSGSQNMSTMLAYAKLFEKVEKILEGKSDD